MGTKIYGSSDNIVYLEGDVSGQVDCYGTYDKEKGVLVSCSDGTMLEVKYGKNEEGVWEVKLLNKGTLFDRIEQCDDPNADIYSDIAYFKDGLKKVFATTGYWAKVD